MKNKAKFSFCNSITAKLIYTFLSLFLFVFISCSNNLSENYFSDNKKYNLLLPEIKKTDFLVFDYWEITINGKETFKKIKTEKKSITIECKNDFPLAVTAIPKFKNQQNANILDFFMQAGTILPYSNEISFETGFSAFILKDILKKIEINKKEADDLIKILQRFNWKKFQHYIKTKTSSKKYNPWILDFSKIEETIMEGTFQTSNLSFGDYILVEKKEILEKADKLISSNQNFATSNIFCKEKAKTALQNYIPLLDSEEIILKKRKTDTILIGFESGKLFLGKLQAQSAKNFSLELMEMPIINAEK